MDDVVAYCLRKIGRPRVDWKTLVVSGRGETRLAPERLWAVWRDLPHWPSWSPIHRSVAPVGGGELTVGGSFDQELDLGFPVGVQRERATFDELEPAVRASWSGDKNGVRSCHVWRFEAAPGGGTRVYNVELFYSTSIGLARPVLGPRWNRMFQGAVDGLIAAAG
ncbi:MAG TPA: SRPBCC family protein [Dactylosporangium sp.]|jgi:hypothetical protein|nr:SRPBCC family protein [Dactylosporangium sp.]